MLFGMGSVICLHPDLYEAAHIHPLALRYFHRDILRVPATGDFEADILALRGDWLSIAGDFRHAYEQEVPKKAV